MTSLLKFKSNKNANNTLTLFFSIKTILKTNDLISENNVSVARSIA